MSETLELTPTDLRAARAEHPKLRDRDLADKLGVSEAQLLAAQTGLTATRIAAHPDRLMPATETLGTVMALTRNPSCVHEKDGQYANYYPGQHAAMILNGAIDLRIFPSHWRHAFAVETETEGGTRRSLQVFDAAGDAVHKIYLRDGADLDAWTRLKADLAIDDQGQTLACDPRTPPEAPKSNLNKADILRDEWRRLTDTHQFLRLCAKLKMNRLGAYRIAGAPFVRRLKTDALDAMLHKAAADAVPIMVFVGNRGCIQIHSGPIETLKPIGPWQNVLDPDFNLHLRLDHVAEVWAVDKPTQRGPAISVEAFDADGSLILQTFGIGKDGADTRPAWNALVDTLESAS
ncbi:hemin-degrading factor [Aestuariibius sp. 2305UL40-4]|uniref:hemin-degrading factor n=1 Tax=Aestuariibius violaceus TaxID=3234132 RepID=UPI00345E2D63